MENTAARVARRYVNSYVAFRDDRHEEVTTTCSSGCSISTWDVAELLAAKGIDFTTVTFVPKESGSKGEVRFVATDRAGRTICTGRVEFTYIVTTEQVTVVAEVVVDER